MSWTSYLPSDVWDKFRIDDSVIAEDLYSYGMVRKHGGATANHELVSLFEKIKELKTEVVALKAEMEARKTYTTSLEELIGQDPKS